MVVTLFVLLQRNCNHCTSLQLSGATEVALLLNRLNFNRGKAITTRGSLLLIDERRIFVEQGWLSGESTRLPPMWPGFDSRSRCHMWVEFVLSFVFLVLPPKVLLRVLRFSSLHKDQHFQIPSRINGRRATLWRCHCKFQFVYFIIYLLDSTHDHWCALLVLS